MTNKPTLTDALKEAYAHAPTGVIQVDTLEFNHANLTTPLRIINGLDDVVAKIETGATVTFNAAPFKFKAPSQGVSPTPEAIVEITNTGGEISSALNQALTSFATIKVIYRIYTQSTLLNGPQLTPPPVFQMVSATSNIGVIKISLRAIDLTALRFPKDLYDV